MELEGIVGFQTSSKNTLTSLPLDLYGEPPNVSVTLQEIEDLFRQRLEMLHIFDADVDYSDESVAVRAADRISNRLQNVKSQLSKSGSSFLRLEPNDQRKFDNISHFLTRLFCARDTEQWTWFVNAEKRFLQYRMFKQLGILDESILASMLSSVQIYFERVDKREIIELMEKNYIYWSQNVKSKLVMSDPKLFKIPFELALPLVQRRKVSLMEGYAMLTADDIAIVLCDEFQQALESTYDWSSLISTQSEETNRLMSTLNIVYQDYKEHVLDVRRQAKLERRETINTNAIDVQNIDEVAKQHFPPCMRHILESLRKNHHLRHQARIYFGTFLRSGGVELDDAIDFFRSEFTKKIPVDKFERDYKYNIRHLYGKEGHRKALTCFSCAKIINDNPPGPADNHACPFKHYDQEHLRSMLRAHEIPDPQINRIANIAESKNFQGACTEYFNVRHGTLPRAPIVNPIQFYNDSMDPPETPIVAPDEHMELTDNSHQEQLAIDEKIENNSTKPQSLSGTSVEPEFEFDD